jgi:LPS export ABC transporter protein LptC
MRSPAQRRHVLTRRILAAAASVAAVATLYALVANREGPDVEIGKPEAQRGYYLTDSTMTEMGPNGRPKFTVHARTAEQELADQSVDMSDITFEYPSEKYGTWHGTARTGHMPPDRKSIALAGDVTMTSTQQQGAAVIHTEHLNYDIDRAIVQTADPVDVRLGSHVLNARGLRADLNAQTLKLESNVNGRFVF